MTSALWSLLFLMWYSCEGLISCPNVKTDLSFVRKRRHLVFSKGSNFALTLSLVKAFLTHVPAGWNLALELDVLFPLPEEAFITKHFRKKLHHRQKKELWKRFEDALNFHNMNGRACILQTICEAKVWLAPPGKSLLHDILRATLNVPELDRMFRKEIRGTYDELLTPHYCEQMGDCPFSLLHLILIFNSRKM